MTVSIQDLNTLLEASTATPEFKTAVRDLSKGSHAGPIQFKRGLPPVKVLRVVTKLLEEEPALQIRNVSVDAFSGCSDFCGKLSLNDGERIYKFSWDCAWRAQQEGLKDFWGQPDQIRAAREFGYQCFKEWQRVE